MMTYIDAMSVFTRGREVRLPNGEYGTVVGTALMQENFRWPVLFVKCHLKDGTERTWPHREFPIAKEI